MIWLDEKKDADAYINANRMKSAFNEDENLIVATQGPKENTQENFWRLCHKERVGRIVTLVKSIGHGPGFDCF